jgi:hypothetical protein
MIFAGLSASAAQIIARCACDFEGMAFTVPLNGPGGIFTSK